MLWSIWFVWFCIQVQVFILFFMNCYVKTQSLRYCVCQCVFCYGYRIFSNFGSFSFGIVVVFVVFGFMVRKNITKGIYDVIELIMLEQLGSSREVFLLNCDIIYGVSYL